MICYLVWGYLFLVYAVLLCVTTWLLQTTPLFPNLSFCVKIQENVWDITRSHRNTGKRMRYHTLAQEYRKTYEISHARTGIQENVRDIARSHRNTGKRTRYRTLAQEYKTTYIRCQVHARQRILVYTWPVFLVRRKCWKILLKIVLFKRGNSIHEEIARSVLSLVSLFSRNGESCTYYLLVLFYMNTMRLS